MDITPHKQTKILTLHEHTSKTQCEIVRTLDVHQSTISHLLKQVKETGTLLPKKTGKCGRKRKTLAKDITRLL